MGYAFIIKVITDRLGQVFQQATIATLNEFLGIIR